MVEIVDYTGAVDPTIVEHFLRRIVQWQSCSWLYEYACIYIFIMGMGLIEVSNYLRKRSMNTLKFINLS